MSVTAVSSKSKARASQAERPAKRRSAKKTEPSQEEIRILAYSLYERRSADGIDGDPISDWIEAERQLTQQ